MEREVAAAPWLRRARARWGQKPNTLEYQFKVENKGNVVLASYTGVLPDTFKDDAEVVLKGRLTSDDALRGRPERRHGQVPVEVRGEGRTTT